MQTPPPRPPEITDTAAHPARDNRRAALVLGARVRPSGEPSPALTRRVSHAIDLWRDGQVSHLILTGGGAAMTEAEAMAQICRAAGLPDSALHLEPSAASTAENLRLSRPILRQLSPAETILVTDAWHLPRALLAARRLGVPAIGSAPKAAPRNRSAKLREAMARGFYYLTLWR